MLLIELLNRDGGLIQRVRYDGADLAAARVLAASLIEKTPPTMMKPLKYRVCDQAGAVLHLDAR